MTLAPLRDRTPQALLFDLDGTLLDSAPDLAQAIDGMLQALDFPQAGEARVRAWVGEGSRMLVRQALMFARGAAPADADIDAAQQVFFEYYGACLTDRSCLFAGVSDALAHWQQAGVAMACVTNKPARFTEPLLDHFDLRRYLPVTVSGDTLPVRKPDPAPLLEACRRLGVSEAHAVMIGDSRNDVLAARAAGMPVVCVTYGYNHGRPIAGEGADRLVDAFGELVGSVAAL
jgi:phosphoglycolate phosphatase